MTEKQEALLKKFLTEQQVREMKYKNFDEISALITMILATRCYNFRDKIEEPSSSIKKKAKELEVFINKRKAHYTSVLDEHCYFTHAFLIKGTQTIIYRFEQSWFKGMSATPTTRWFFVLEDGSKLTATDYSILYDANIRAIWQLLEALYTHNHNYEIGDHDMLETVKKRVTYTTKQCLRIQVDVECHKPHA